LQALRRIIHSPAVNSTVLFNTLQGCRSPNPLVRDLLASQHHWRPAASLAISKHNANVDNWSP